MIFFKDCARCKHLIKDGNCRGTSEWWPLRELWLCRIQMMFLLANLDAYPQNPYTSGYTEAARTSYRVKANAPFEAEGVLWSEVNYRLDRTGAIGKWLLREVQLGVTLGELAYEPRQALHYMSGWKRKPLAFAKWQWEQTHRRKHDKISSKLTKY